MININYTIKNIEPLKIMNISKSMDNNHETQLYIPGSMIRGVVINYLSKLKNFESDKKNLLSERLCFKNVLPHIEGKIVIPSPKGFYEMKDGSNFKSVLKNGDFEEGSKRANLGNYAFIEDGKIVYFNVKTDNALRIKVSKNKDEQEVFTTNFIAKDQFFRGTIKLDDTLEKYQDLIVEALSKGFYVGGSSSSGYGRCVLESIEISKESQLTNSYSFKIGDTLPEEIYMLLLSPMTMRNEIGEICGLDEKNLSNQIGDLTLCATSISEYSGINHKWKSRTPVMTMYDAGSIFKFKTKENLDIKAILDIQDAGLGLKREEGYGSIVFLKDFDKIASKEEYKKYDENHIINKDVSKKIETYKVQNLNKFEKETLDVILKGILLSKFDKSKAEYIYENSFPKGNLSHSQIGNIQAKLEGLMFRPEKSKEILDDMFANIDSKKSGKSTKYDKTKAYIYKILETELVDILNLDLETMLNNYNKKLEDIVPKNEQIRYKLKIMTEQIDMNRKNNDSKSKGGF